MVQTQEKIEKGIFNEDQTKKLKKELLQIKESKPFMVDLEKIQKEIWVKKQLKQQMQHTLDDIKSKIMVNDEDIE